MAEQTECAALMGTDVVHTPPQTSRESESYPTVASISEQRRAQTRTQLPSQTNEPQTATYAVPDAERPAPGSPEDLEQEASQEGAFNEETGEINWDCPCLGGMAYGPCGEQFRAAFSCFVFSKEEPKGVDCIEHFKAMQTCFREHPDVYGAELEDDEASAEGEGDQPVAVPMEPATPEVRSVEPSQQDQKASNARPPPDNTVSTASEQQDRAQAPTEQIRLDHGATSDQVERFPKSSYDARSGS